MEVFLSTVDFLDSTIYVTHSLSDQELHPVSLSLSAVRQFLDLHTSVPLDCFKLVSARLYRAKFTGTKCRIFCFKFVKPYLM